MSNIITVDYGNISGGVLESRYTYGGSTPPSSDTFNIGFRPKYLIATGHYASTGQVMTCIYDAEVSTTTFVRYFSSNECTTYTISTSSGVAGISAISDTGFTYTYATEMHYFSYLALG